MCRRLCICPRPHVRSETPLKVTESSWSERFPAFTPSSSDIKCTSYYEYNLRFRFVQIVGDTLHVSNISCIWRWSLRITYSCFYIWDCSLNTVVLQNQRQHVSRFDLCHHPGDAGHDDLWTPTHTGCRNHHEGGPDYLSKVRFSLLHQHENENLSCYEFLCLI